MTSQHDKPKRGQFGLRGMWAFMSLYCVPLAILTTSYEIKSLLLLWLGASMLGGAAGSAIGWLATGETIGFVFGYVWGAYAATFIPLALVMAGVIPVN